MESDRCAAPVTGYRERRCCFSCSLRISSAAASLPEAPPHRRLLKICFVSDIASLLPPPLEYKRVPSAANQSYAAQVEGHCRPRKRLRGSSRVPDTLPHRSRGVPSTAAVQDTHPGRGPAPPSVGGGEHRRRSCHGEEHADARPQGAPQEGEIHDADEARVVDGAGAPCFMALAIVRRLS